MRMNKASLALAALAYDLYSVDAEPLTNTVCTSMQPICTADNYEFEAESGSELLESETNNYDCLRSQPNPTWFFLKIDDSGEIVMRLFAPNDIDFNMWGPYDSVAEAVSLCDGGLVASAQLDCSYSETNDETIRIDNAISGKIYVLLLTNYADTVQTMKFSKTGGPGTTNCDIVDNFTTSPSDVPSEKPSAAPSNWHHDNVELGTAGNFAILTKSGVTTTGATSVTGSMGTSPIAGTALTGFALTLDVTGTHSTSPIVNGFVFAADHGSLTPDMMTIAISDMEAAYVDAAGRAGPDVVVGLGAGNLSGLTLGPGIYKWSTNVGVTTTVTFEGTSTDVWIIQIAGTFTAGPDASIILSGDAKAENIYWAIADVVHFDDRSHGEGIFLAQTMISFNEGSSLHGAALAQTAVTMIATNITGALTPSSFYIEV